MDSKQYLEESAKTLSPSYHKELVTTNELEAMFYAAQVSSDWADRLKKALFYAKPYQPKTSPHTATSLQHPSNPDILHAILGLFTEAGELMEHYAKVLKGQETLDLVNLNEEVGDLLWYCAIIWRATGRSPEETMQTNIAKLKARYPTKFTELAAQQRDLDFERTILESK